MNNEYNFEVGKWYKVVNLPNFGRYFKFSSWKVPNKVMGVSETLYLSVSDKLRNSRIIDNPHWFEAEELTDLSEIQQYLPEGHPDKISNEIINNYAVY